MAKATSDFDITFKEAARRTLLAHFDKMMSHLPGTRTGEQMEHLHQMRVGSRRLRAALSVFAKVFPKAEFRTLDKQIGDITDALGAVRDLDVQMDYLRGVRDPLPENEAYGLTRLIDQLSDERDERRKELVKALKRLEKERFAAHFRKTLDRAVPPPVGGEAAERMDDVAVPSEFKRAKQPNKGGKKATRPEPKSQNAKNAKEKEA